MDTEIVKIILAFMVLINPSSALPIFIGLTEGACIAEKRKVARVACVAVFIAIAFFTVLGETLLRGLGISVGSFQVAGGVLIFLIAVGMINGSGNIAKPKEVDVDAVHNLQGPMSSAVVPLAIPMMIGPGGISTVIIYSSQLHTPMQITTVIVAGFFIALICYMCLMAADKVGALLGATGINIMSRIMGILLAAVAVEILISGLRTLFPALG